MTKVQQAVESLTAGCQTDHFLDVKIAARSVGIHPNKISEWVYRTARTIAAIYRDQPGEMAATMALWMAKAEAKRQETSNEGREHL